MKKEKELTDEEFEKLKNPEVDLEAEEEEFNKNLKTAYRNIMDILKEYLDLKEEYYNIIALWIIGTYFHSYFPSYPYLYFNAMKGSGKTRAMNLITSLAYKGEILNSMTEAVLFRTQGTLAIDEFEGVNRKGNENLRELLNSCYKRGTKVKRMKQQKTLEGVQQVVEEFEVYRPIILANIWGMENVLGDRCVTLILERSGKKEITNLIEIFREEFIVQETVKILNQCRLCRCRFSGELYKEWNSYIKQNNTNNTNNTYNINNNNNTNYTITFEILKKMDLNGRELELSFPLCILATFISSGTLKKTTLTLKNIFDTKKEEEFNENLDVSFYDFVSQFPDFNWVSVTQLVKDFKQFLDSNDDWINNRWLGRALKRLDLVKETRRMGNGRYVILNLEKAQEKIKMFKVVEPKENEPE